MSATSYSVFTFILLKNLNNSKIKKLIRALSVGFYLFQVFFFFYFKSQKIDSVPVGVETILVIFYSILYFHQYFKFSQVSIYTDPNFYLVVGILVYLGGTFFFNILANEITTAQWDNYWYLTYIPEIIKNIIFAITIVIYHKKTNTLSKKTLNVPYLDMI